MEGAQSFVATGEDGLPIPGPTVAITGLVHGNEPVGRMAIERLHQHIEGSLLKGRVLTVLCNLEAEAMGLRHTPTGSDMNRLWALEDLRRLEAADPKDLSYEGRRVRELAPVLRQAEVILDLHSTSRPSPPHLILRDDLAHAALGRQLGVERLVTGVHEGAILSGGLCCNLDLELGVGGPRVGITLEAGQHSNPANVEAAWQVVERLLDAHGMWGRQLPPLSGRYEVFEVIERVQQRPEGEQPYRFVGYEGGEPGAGRLGPPRHLASFESIEADEVVLRRGDHEVHRAHTPFTMIMPAPTAGPGEDLYYVAQRRHASLQRRPESDGDAQQEAGAIERMLDLLTDDEAQRGDTRVSFDGRRSLDLCADIVTRVCRLPEGHPHRKLVLVGRGDEGDDERSLRERKRYHQALKLARDAKVPVERIQLLRGAAFGWYKQMGEVLLSGGEAGIPMQLRVSQRQPHTLSLIIAGDPKLAQETGEYHHVRVAYLIEATTVEPGGDKARMQFARVALFGARPELVSAAMRLLRVLREEHRQLCDSGWLGTPARLQGLLDETGALVARTPEDADRITRVLGEATLGLWRRVLQHEMTQPLLLRSQESAARWLARLMAASGIYDPYALSEAVVRQEDTQWAVQPSRLTQPDLLPRLLTAAPEGRHLPDQVLTSSEIDRDNIEQWVGWKRFLRETELIPGTRGKHIDLAFTAASIQRRAGRWFTDAMTYARKEPGQWLLVIAGDGLSPQREQTQEGFDVVLKHRQLLTEPGLRYLRIQNARGTHLGWMKDVFHQLAKRPANGEPVAICWEPEHGSTVNVCLLCRRDTTGPTDPWTLEDWTIERCGVLVSEGGTDEENAYQVGLFTERQEGLSPSQALRHFGRAHCEGLMRQTGPRLAGRTGLPMTVAMQQLMQRLLTDQIQRVEDIHEGQDRSTSEPRGEWLARSLGIVDPELTPVLPGIVDGAEDPAEAAAELWSIVEPWPRDP